MTANDPALANQHYEGSWRISGCRWVPHNASQCRSELQVLMRLSCVKLIS